ncbi:hypothetical protein F4824DRAFT_471485 [Ustulina deusta]|nr:hypothetical protein F4824DRAFT_471485 [Ustulina deusta]
MLLFAGLPSHKVTLCLLAFLPPRVHGPDGRGMPSSSIQGLLRIASRRPRQCNAIMLIYHRRGLGFEEVVLSHSTAATKRGLTHR